MASKQPEQGNTSAGSPAPQQRPQPPPQQPKPQGTVNLLTNFLAACARNIAATATGALGPVSSPSSSPIGDGARPSPSTPLPPGEGARATAHPPPAAGPRRNSRLGTQPNHATLPDSVVHDDVSRPPAAQPAGSSTGHHPSAMAAVGPREETSNTNNNSSGNDELDEVVSATVPDEGDGAGGRSGDSNNNNGLTLNFADDPYQVRESEKKKEKKKRTSIFCHFVRKCKNRLHINISINWSLYFRPNWCSNSFKSLACLRT